MERLNTLIAATALAVVSAAPLQASPKQAQEELAHNLTTLVTVAQKCGFGVTVEFMNYYAVSLDMVDTDVLLDVAPKARAEQDELVTEYGTHDYCAGSLIFMGLQYDMDIYVIPEGLF